MLNEKLWVYEKVSDEKAAELSKKAGVSILTAKVLLSRGMSEAEEAIKFMNPSLDDLHNPFLLADMEKAADRIVTAIKGVEKVVLYGDYDVDGITGISVLLDFLRGLGVDAGYYIPDRIEEGYGLSVGAIDRILESKPSLIITVDCGIAALEEVRYINERNTDVIITDHHECQEELPEAYAVVNPCRPDCGYPFKELAGVGVVFKLVHALCMKMGLGDAYMRYLDLVALGTVADVVPLRDENRIIVKYGIPAIENTSNIGLRALVNVAGLKDKPLNTYSIGFIIAPRINAAGRIGDAGRAVRLFTTHDEEEALSISVELNDENRYRQETEVEILKQAESAIASDVDIEKEKVLIVSGESWHHGVIGIVASRITEKYHRPCILFSGEKGIYKGSGRSIEGFNLFKALVHCEDLLEKYGGHELAAGLTIKGENLQAFREMINDYADSILQEEDLKPKLRIDAYADMEDLTLENAKELEMLAPFGCGNSSPVLAFDGFRLDDVRTVGDNKHLKLKLNKNGFTVDAIGFNMGELACILAPKDVVDAAFSLEVNTWNGIQSVQLNLKDLRCCGETAAKNRCLYNLDKHIESGGIKEYNEYISFFSADEIIPERPDLAAIYRYLKANCRDSMVIDNLFGFAEKIAASYGICMNYLKLKKGIEIFDELKLLKAEPVGKFGMKITFNGEVKGKTDLENSVLYRKLQDLKKDILKNPGCMAGNGYIKNAGGK